MNSTQPEGGISTSAPHFSFTKNFLHNVSQLHKTLWVAALLITLLATTAVVFFYSRDTKDAAVEQYTLVADKISRSAPIAIMLPEGTEFANFDPATSIVFSPEIKGAWEKSDAIGDKTSKVYRFLPTEKLAIGAYYLATLTTPELMMEKMFSVRKQALSTFISGWREISQ